MKHLIHSNHLKMARRISLAVTVLIAAGALATSDPAVAELTGTVTAVDGDASVGEHPAEISDLVSRDESIVTGPEGSCSVLVDKRALVQFCGQAAVQLRHDEERNATIVDVLEGSTRTLAGPRRADEPLEIHTPVAIAAILGTILSVTVDPATGDATFALEEGKAQIETRDPAHDRSITLNAGEQVTVYADGRVGEVQPLRPRDLPGRPDCLEDRFFHGASVEIARVERLQWLTDAITSADIPYAGLPPVAAGPELPLEPRGSVDEPLDPNPSDPCGLSAICTGNVDLPEPDPVSPREPEGRSRGQGHHNRPQPCGGVPGEHCY
jgi:hypothetical protein